MNLRDLLANPTRVTAHPSLADHYGRCTCTALRLVGTHRPACPIVAARDEWDDMITARADAIRKGI